MALFNDRITNGLTAVSALASGNTVGEQLGNTNAVLAQQRAGAATQAQLNASRQALLQQYPQFASEINAADGQTLSSMVNAAWKQRMEAQQPKKPNLMNLGNGFVMDADTQKVIPPPDGYEQPKLPAAAEEYNFAVSQGFKGGFQDYQKYKTSLDDGKTSDKFKTEVDTMKAYRGEDPVKTYQATRDAYEKVRTSAQLGSAQGDIGLIFGFMKMLDPGSVVREGEFATAQNSGGIDETVYNIYNKALNGERLTPEQRQKFVQAAEAQYRNTEKNLQEVNTRYTGLADAYDVPTERFLEVPKAYPPLKIGDPPSEVLLPGGKKATIKKISD